MNPATGINMRPELSPATAQFMQDAIEGLSARPKRMPAKYFYDETGAALFEEITRLPEYYLTRAEFAILRGHAREIARAMGPNCRLVELGGASSAKVRFLLEHLEAPCAYLPVDICREQLVHSVGQLSRDFPDLPVVPVHADFSRKFELPDAPAACRSTVVYFPGSTIGNLEPTEVKELMRRVARLAGPGGGFLVGFDLIKNRAVLEAAYNDSQRITEAFNLNLLDRLGRELGADFQRDRFAHLAFYNVGLSRIEMHLVSTVRQSIRLNGTVMQMEAGETIHTESSYKYEVDGLEPAAREAGFARAGVWNDPERNFSVQLFRRLSPDLGRPTRCV